GWKLLRSQGIQSGLLDPDARLPSQCSSSVVLAAINPLRKRHGAAALTYDGAMAQKAQDEVCAWKTKPS
ncbi:hypothetical protein, partial [Klebsiella pneumoniae]|uniref:hypothetical protein n=1 Tax=Klebsiella pneumoniae TaxID=573 RepID=UPI0025A243C7